MVRTNIMTYFALNLNNYKNISESELLDATCFFCDLVEYAYNTDEAMNVELSNKFMEIFKWTDSIDVKQTLSYGMGIFASHIPQTSYAKILPNTFQAVISMITAQDAYEDENIVATETAVGALGKLIYKHKDNQIINDQSVLLFCTKLPLVAEEEEATKTHMLFCQNVAAKNPNLLSANTATAVKDALTRIKKESETNEDITVLKDDAKALLNSLL